MTRSQPQPGHAAPDCCWPAAWWGSAASCSRSASDRNPPRDCGAICMSSWAKVALRHPASGPAWSARSVRIPRSRISHCWARRLRSPPAAIPCPGSRARWSATHSTLPRTCNSRASCAHGAPWRRPLAPCGARSSWTPARCTWCSAWRASGSSAQRRSRRQHRSAVLVRRCSCSLPSARTMQACAAGYWRRH
jgi:hypothetical protein